MRLHLLTKKTIRQKSGINPSFLDDVDFDISTDDIAKIIEEAKNIHYYPKVYLKEVMKYGC